MDLHAVEDVVLEPGAPRLVPTGLTIEIPPGYEAQVRPVSYTHLDVYKRQLDHVAANERGRSLRLELHPVWAGWLSGDSHWGLRPFRLYLCDVGGRLTRACPERQHHGSYRLDILLRQDQMCIRDRGISGYKPKGYKRQW